MLKKILVALDSSDLSDQVIQMMQHLDLQPESNVVIAHVVVQIGANPDVAADRPQVSTEVIPYQSLEKLQTYQSTLPCKSEIEIVTGGEPAEEIVRLANIHHVDLIVLGSRGLTGMDRILRGSVSSQVLEEAPCSVLVVKQN